jgi:hypothetical protein
MTSRLDETIRTLGENQCINLGGCRLDDAGAIAGALKINTSVDRIWLDSNHIGDAGASVLADALTMNMCVTTIGLSNNHIGGKGATALAEALKLNTSVTAMHLHFNQIGNVASTVNLLTDRNARLKRLFLFDARRMLLSLMCADECGVV